MNKSIGQRSQDVTRIIEDRCYNCQESTKEIVAAYEDSCKPSLNDKLNFRYEHFYRYIFTCQSGTCDIAIKRRDLEAEANKIRAETQAENEKNEVTPIRLKYERTKAGVTMREISRALGVDPTEYSKWEMEITPMPQFYYIFCLGYYQACENHNCSQCEFQKNSERVDFLDSMAKAGNIKLNL
jgi:hypothetical protein